MKRRDLTRERLRELLRYSARTGVFTWRVDRSRMARAGQVAGNLNMGGHVNICIDGTPYKAHRLAWLYAYGAWPSGRLDHKNTNGADNRLRNLRETTHSQNIANSRRRRDNTSGFKGVCRFGNKWMANINKDGTRHYLGLHPTPIKAHKAYAAAADRLFGEFARSL